VKILKDFIVVGGGVGGVLSAGVLKKRGYKTLLIEKDKKNLGGSSGSFRRGKYVFNIGATTFAGFHKGTPLHSLITEIDADLPIYEIDPALSVIQSGKETKRYRELDNFLDEIHRDYPHQKNREFWELVKNTNYEFYKFQNYWYSDKNFFQKLLSITSFLPIALKFNTKILENGRKFIEKFFGEISNEYLNFIDNQILIVAQKKSDEVNALVSLIALGYTFMPNYYVEGGMENIFKKLSKNLEIARGEVFQIETERKKFKIKIKKETIETKNLVLNTTVFDTERLFCNQEIRDYYNDFKNLNSFQSAFVIYGVLKSDKKLEHHYQIIKKDILEYGISNSIFVSFSDLNDLTSAPEGERTFTISTHVDERVWENISKEGFKIRKKCFENQIMKLVFNDLKIEESEITQLFSANPKTFKKYINRKGLGGIPMSEIFLKVPSNITPFRGLFHVGDTTFPAQGWLGVATGVNNFLRHFPKI
jgi:phytoene dehydrogenase-like protein